MKRSIQMKLQFFKHISKYLVTLKEKMSTILTGLLGTLFGSIIGTLVERFKKRGEITMRNYSLEIFYSEKGETKLIDKFELNTQFTNTSGYTKNLDFEWIDFTVGSLETYLSFTGQPYPPSYALKEKDSASYKNILGAENHNSNIIVDNFNHCVFRLRYSIGNKTHTLVITPKEFILNKHWFAM